jgi:hypothetical protein
MLTIYRNDPYFLNSMEDVQRYIMDLVCCFGEWAKHVICEERRVSIGNSGLVLHKSELFENNSIQYWFSIDPFLWGE